MCLPRPLRSSLKHRRAKVSLPVMIANGSVPFADCFPVPSLTMHFVMAGDDGTTSIDALSGKHVLIGRGTFSAGEAARYFRLFGLEDSVRLADASITNGPEALREGRIDAFVTASSYPTPNVIETASLVPITLVSFTAEQIAQTGAVPQVIPGGTYPRHRSAHAHDVDAGSCLHHRADGCRDGLPPHEALLGAAALACRAVRLVGKRHTGSAHPPDDPRFTQARDATTKKRVWSCLPMCVKKIVKLSAI